MQEVAQADTEMQTEYAICYCKNRADSAMVIRVRKALAAAKPELLLDSSYFVPWLLPGKARLIQLNIAAQSMLFLLMSGMLLSTTRAWLRVDAHPEVA